jgi:hypothetical protein
MDVDAGREGVAVKVRVCFRPLAGEHSRSSLVTDSVHWDRFGSVYLTPQSCESSALVE